MYTHNKMDIINAILANIITSFVWAVIIASTVYFFINMITGKINENYKKSREEIIRVFEEVVAVVKESFNKYLKFLEQTVNLVVTLTEQATEQAKMLATKQMMHILQPHVQFRLEVGSDEDWRVVTNLDDIGEEWVDINCETIDESIIVVNDISKKLAYDDDDGFTSDETTDDGWISI